MIGQRHNYITHVHASSDSMRAKGLGIPLPRLIRPKVGTSNEVGILLFLFQPLQESLRENLSLPRD